MIIPSHVGIIMDGNGRWAERIGKKRTFGHKKGSENVERVVKHAFNKGVKTVTVYAFSTENWQRPEEEVNELMRLLGEYLKKLSKVAVKNKIKIRVIGEKNRLCETLQQTIETETQKTVQFTEHTLNICIDYGGRQEIVSAVKQILEKNQELTPENIEKNLYTEGQPLDLIIRTGGEIRLSNFLLFQSAYAELYFTDTLWPDFDEAELDKALESFSSRQRRYGKV